MKRSLLFLVAIFVATAVYCQTIPLYVPLDSLQAWYPFNGNANDVSGNGHDGTADSAYLTTDRCGDPNSAYYFNGLNSYINIADAFFNNGWYGYTVAFWLNSDTLSNPLGQNANQAMFNTNPHNGMELAFDWGGVTQKYDLYTGTNPPSGAWDIYGANNAASNTTVTTHVWNHIALVKEGSSYYMYINGLLDNTFQANITSPGYYCSLVLGNIAGSLDEAFWGKLDDYGIWNRTLSSAEVFRLYQSNCVTGIADIAVEDNFSVYPNPASDLINVDVRNIALKGAVYNIVDITGRVVLKGELTIEHNMISINGLAPAIYILQVEGAKELSYKIVKN